MGNFLNLHYFFGSANPEIHFVVADFACSASEYCLNRQGSFYKDAQFFIDRFHSVNHKCHGFKARFQSGNPKFLVPNTSICEQFNSHIQHVALSCNFMAWPLFMFIMQLVVFLWNGDKEESSK
jgi:hypothetical protein